MDFCSIPLWGKQFSFSKNIALGKPISYFILLLNHKELSCKTGLNADYYYEPHSMRRTKATNLALERKTSGPYSLTWHQLDKYNSIPWCCQNIALCHSRKQIVSQTGVATGFSRKACAPILVSARTYTFLASLNLLMSMKYVKRIQI